MKSNLPAPTAKNINEAYEFAREHADCAVEWATKCGLLLAAKKDELGRGEFDRWVAEHCKFGRATAYNYIKHAKSSNALDGSAIRHLFPSGQPGAKKSDTPKGAVSVVKPKGTEETGKDRPAASTTPPARASQPPGAEIRPGARPAEIVDEDSDAPEHPDDIDEDAALAAAEADYARRIDAVMQSDNKLAEAQAQLKQQASLISVLETTRDGYMRGKDAVTKLLQAEQRKVAKLEKENKSLRDRLAALEGKAA